MADDIDFNEALDNIVLAEESERQESYKEGYRAGTESGNPEGYHLGYHRGAELGRELGYYLGIITHHLQSKDIDQEKYTERIIKQLQKAKELIESFPRTNSEEHDIEEMVENIRGHYKKICALLKISSANPFNSDVSF